MILMDLLNNESMRAKASHENKLQKISTKVIQIISISWSQLIPFTPVKCLLIRHPMASKTIYSSHDPQIN